MAHEIEFNNEHQRFAFVTTEKAWHALGVQVDKAMTAEEAMAQSLTNFEVVKVPNFARVGEGPDFIPAPNSWSTVRTDTNAVLGSRMADSYTVIQNREVFSAFDELFKNDARIETAGSLFGGRKVFMTAKLPSYIRVNGTDDVLEKYIFFMTSHDGSCAVTGAVTPVRVVCNNTLNAAFQKCTNKVTIRHSVKEYAALEKITQLMGVINSYTEQAQEVFTAMARTPYTDDQVKLLVKNLFVGDLKADNPEEWSTRLINLTELVMNYAGSAKSQQLSTVRGTMFGAYNAITGYFQNAKNYASDEQKLNSIMFNGYAADKSKRAFELLAAEL